MHRQMLLPNDMNHTSVALPAGQGGVPWAWRVRTALMAQPLRQLFWLLGRTSWLAEAQSLAEEGSLPPAWCEVAHYPWGEGRPAGTLLERLALASGVHMFYGPSDHRSYRRRIAVASLQREGRRLFGLDSPVPLELQGSRCVRGRPSRHSWAEVLPVLFGEAALASCGTDSRERPPGTAALVCYHESRAPRAPEPGAAQSDTATAFEKIQIRSVETSHWFDSTRPESPAPARRAHAPGCSPTLEITAIWPLSQAAWGGVEGSFRAVGPARATRVGSDVDCLILPPATTRSQSGCSEPQLATALARLVVTRNRCGRCCQKLPPARKRNTSIYPRHAQVDNPRRGDAESTSVDVRRAPRAGAKPSVAADNRSASASILITKFSGTLFLQVTKVQDRPSAPCYSSISSCVTDMVQRQLPQ
eukprot:scaffold4372_cov397-Prasinococcus_capsulatus_cf.AAC.33